MPYVITSLCTNDGACVEVCPVACIHTTPGAKQFYIDPDVCIDCEQCEIVCPVDAIFKAIRAIVPHPDARLKLYQVHAVTGGTDAQAEVSVRLEEKGKTVNGQGADADTLVASARAYIHALNKLLVKRSSVNPQTGETAVTR